METLISIVPNLPSFFTMFLTLYLISYFSIFRHWSPKDRKEASSCAISLAHGTPVAALSAFCIFTQSHFSFDSPNTHCQNTALDYSIAYFLMDLLHYLIFFPSDVLFIGHHLATTFVMITCRYVARHGATGILALLLLAELTSFCQNVWTLAGMRRFESKAAGKLYTIDHLVEMARGLDSAWQFGTTLDKSMNRLQGNFCKKKISGGIMRLMYRLAGITSNFIACRDDPVDIKQFFLQHLHEMKGKGVQKIPKQKDEMEEPHEEEDSVQRALRELEDSS